jgi:hypothetical protein
MDAGLHEAVMGPIWAALGAVGHKGLSEVENEAADGTVRLGRDRLVRLRHCGEFRDAARPHSEAAAADFASEPEDEDIRSALRGQVNKALSGADGLRDPGLAADLKELLEAAGLHVSAEGIGAVAVGHNEGIISTGSNTKNEIRRGRA